MQGSIIKASYPSYPFICLAFCFGQRPNACEEGSYAVSHIIPLCVKASVAGLPRLFEVAFGVNSNDFKMSIGRRNPFPSGQSMDFANRPHR